MRAPLAALALVAVGLGCATTGAAGASGGATGALVDFSAELHGDLDGKKLVYVDFWATWCGPCGAEMPQLERLYETYKDQGFTVLAVSMDDPTTMGAVTAYVHRNGLTFPVAIDSDSRATSLYNSTRSAPYGVLFDRNGRIVDEHAGYTPGDEAALETKIKAHL